MVMYSIEAAFLEWLLFHYRTPIFVNFFTTNLAGYSKALTLYDASINNTFGLAVLAWVS